jgi:hypothetical protein
VGSAGAEEDMEFLSSCFVDTGDLQVLRDMGNPRQLIIGRTGTGKSALLIQLAKIEQGRVINVVPESLALTYLTNSTLLKFFADLGVNLDPFFKLLWRHVLTVEVLKAHFKVNSSTSKESLLDRVKRLVSGSSEEERKEVHEALSYLEKWGKSFWQETEYRVREITSKVENDLKAEAEIALGGKVLSANLGSVLASRLTEEQKLELRERGQNVISQAQIQDLLKVIRLVDFVLSDKQKNYYLVIDGLDENWVEERMRYKLIMALILTARDFQKVRNAKIVVALRRDLIDRVFRVTRESGFQEEKYRSLYLPLTWSDDQLIEILDLRINKLVRPRYTKKVITHKDLLPEKFNKQPISEYICERARRPRDIIDFFNRCIESAPQLTKLRAAELKAAEGEYSRGRLRALGDEWGTDYPKLLDFVAILHNRPKSFKVENVTIDELEGVCLKAMSGPEDSKTTDPICLEVKKIYQGVANSDLRAFLYFLLHTFYKTGIVGLKLYNHQKESWSDELGASISSTELTEGTSVIVHPALYRAFGIKG